MNGNESAIQPMTTLTNLSHDTNDSGESTVKQIYFVSSGLRGGYTPQYRAFHTDLDSALDDLRFIHEIGQKRMRMLKRDLYVDLSLHYHGAQYAMIEQGSPSYFDLTNDDLDDLESGDFEYGW